MFSAFCQIYTLTINRLINGPCQVLQTKENWTKFRTLELRFLDHRAP